ncbi:MAG: bifunctional UDP-N-acetylglucosamine diphosphorylase/glucosamine-1-phosphate N-acetyltransferase GlmU [Nitrospirota bacterium]
MNLTVVILAAGLGKRMKSGLPKVLHESLGKPMLQHVIDALKPLKPSKIVVVIGNGADEVRRRIKDDKLSFVLQKKLLGTGDALSVARKELKKGTTLVLNGDGPLMTSGTLRKFLSKHRSSKNLVSFLSFKDESMSGYGRVIRDENKKVTGIVEDKHATPDERKMFRELNGGVYLLETAALNFLDRIKKNPSSGEYYITDIVELACRAGKRVDTYNCPSEEIRGVNSREQLYQVTEILKRRVISKLMEKGVTFIDPETSVVHASVSIGRDSIIYPNTYIEGTTSIGKNCVIYPGARIVDSKLGEGVVVKDSTLIEESRIGSGTSVGPFAHLRPMSLIGRNVKIGNFVEVKKSTLADGTKASHLTYLGDADVGKNVNIGAGTITCNYDGINKFKTEIEADVFIGSDSQLVAPVKIGKGAYVAAGATVTRNVPPEALAISRKRQENLIDWVKIKKKRAESKTLKAKKNKK